MTKAPCCWHLLSNRWNSAITEYALSAARALAESGCESLFSPLVNSPAEDRARGYGMRVEPFSGFGFGSIGQAKKLSREFSPDAVFLYGGPETTLARFFPARRKIRFRGQAMETGTFANWRQRMSHAHIDGIVVPGSELRRSASAVFGKDMVHEIILGCDTKKYEFRPVGSRARPEMLIFGRFDPVKGHREFFPVFRKIIDRWPEDKPMPLLTIAGEPANVTTEMLVESAKRFDLDETYLRIFSGRFSDVAQMMAEATLGVVSSLGSEQICRVAEEFLLCGTPVGVTGVGSLGDVLFKNAGFNYQGLGLEDTAAVFRKHLLEAFLEPESVRRERAKRAEALFSLTRMGQALRAVIA